MAAVLGREFHRQVLAAIAAAPVPQVDRLLDQAVTARLVAAWGRAGSRSRTTWSARRSTPRSARRTLRRRHAAVVRAIDRRPALADRRSSRPTWPGTPTSPASDLEPARAVDHLVAAARDAAGRMAIEECIGHYRRALERARAGEPAPAGRDRPRSRPRAAPRRPPRRGLAGIRGGRRRRPRGWTIPSCWPAWRSVSTGPPTWTRAGEAQAEGRPAHARRTAGWSATAAPHRTGRVAGPVARELTMRAAVLARRGNDDEALAFSLWARHDAIWGPGTATERAALTDELMAVARRTGDPARRLSRRRCAGWRCWSWATRAYLDQFERCVALAERRACRCPASPRPSTASIIATLQGRSPRPTRCSTRRSARRRPEPRALRVHGAITSAGRCSARQGRFDELDGAAPVRCASGHPFVRTCWWGSRPSQRGRRRAALRHLRAPTTGGARPTRPFVPAVAALPGAARGGHPRSRSCARGPERDWRRTPASGSCRMYGCDISGPVDLWLAMLDAAQERWDDAVAGFTAACSQPTGCGRGRGRSRRGPPGRGAATAARCRG